MDDARRPPFTPAQSGLGRITVVIIRLFAPEHSSRPRTQYSPQNETAVRWRPLQDSYRVHGRARSSGDDQRGYDEEELVRPCFRAGLAQAFQVEVVE